MLHQTPIIKVDFNIIERRGGNFKVELESKVPVKVGLEWMKIVGYGKDSGNGVPVTLRHWAIQASKCVY